MTGGTAPSTICSAIPSWKPEHWHIDNLHHNVDHVPRFGIADHLLQTLRDWHIDVLFDAPSHLHCRVNRGSRAISAAMNGSCHGQAHRQLLTAPVASQTSHASTLCCRSNVTTSHGPGVRRFKRATWSSCTGPSCLQRASKKAATRWVLVERCSHGTTTVSSRRDCENRWFYVPARKS